jgi:hypothetical protein
MMTKLNAFLALGLAASLYGLWAQNEADYWAGYHKGTVASEIRNIVIWHQVDPGHPNRTAEATLKQVIAVLKEEGLY